MTAGHILAFLVGACSMFIALAAWACVKVGADSDEREDDGK